MKAKECKRARFLRMKGFSVREIAATIKCSKSSISKWVSGIALTKKQVERLKSNQDKGRAKAAQHPNSPKAKWARIRNDIINQAAGEIPARFSPLSLKILGVSLYWAEGYNASRNLFLFSNSSPDMIKIMMKFLRDICWTPKDKIKARVNIHPHLDIQKAEVFWSHISGISRNNFTKPLLSVSKASRHKRDTLPLGTFNIIVCDVRLVSKIKGWIKGLKEWASSSAG